MKGSNVSQNCDTMSKRSATNGSSLESSSVIKGTLIPRGARKALIGSLRGAEEMKRSFN